jgi:hypothetical protein
MISAVSIVTGADLDSDIEVSALTHLIIEWNEMELDMVGH